MISVFAGHSMGSRGPNASTYKGCADDAQADLNPYMSRLMRKPVLPYANNKGADQPAHPCSLISTFVVRCLYSTISLVSISEISSL